MSSRILSSRLRLLLPSLHEPIISRHVSSSSSPSPIATRHVISPFFFSRQGSTTYKPPPSLQPITVRYLATTSRRNPTRVDIGARARQLQTRRLWTYALTFACIAGFVTIVLSTFQDQLVFYITPTDALAKFVADPSKSKFRLGGLVLEGSVVNSPSSAGIEFVVTDLITDILVKYEGSLPDLFREGHSVVVEGFVRPIDGDKEKGNGNAVSEKARSTGCYFRATEVLAKHDEKYMPQEVAAAIEQNKKKLEAEGHATSG